MKPFLLIFLSTIFTFSVKTNAAVNIALTAKAAHSGGGATIYSAANYNDDIIVPCASTCALCSATPWGWVTSGAAQWIEYTWTSPQTFDKVVFFKSNRPLTQTTLQYWNGSAYVDIVKYNSTVCATDSITFPEVTTTKLRFYGMGTSSNPNFREIQVFRNTLPCNGKPAPGVLSSESPSGTFMCKDSLVTLNVKGATISPLGDIKYQYQRRAIGSGATWTFISGANDTVYTADSLIGWEYRMVTICMKTKDTSYSNIHTMPMLPSPSLSIAPIGPGTFCLGDTVWLKTTNYAGGIYTWMKDGVEVPGWVFNDFAATDAGEYFVKVVTADPCPGISKPIKLKITDPGFSVNLNPVSDSIFCEDESITISGVSSKPGTSFQWRFNNAPIPAATSPSYVVKASGYYRLAANDGGSCAALSRNVFFIMNPKPVAKITVPGGVFTACEGEGIRLDANTSFAYQWSKNGVLVVGWFDDSLIVRSSGKYTVKITTPEGCVAVSDPVDVAILPTPEPVITKTGFVLSTAPSFDFYTWKRNGLIEASGAGLSSINITKKGLYTVTVTDLNGCIGTSPKIEADDAELGINQIAAMGAAIKIYPNPSSSKVFINAPVNVNVSVESINGQVLIQQKNVTEINLDGLADGIYIFSIRDQEGQLLKKEKISKLSR